MPFAYPLRDRFERVDRLLDRNLAVMRRAPHGAVRSVALQRRRVLLPRPKWNEMQRSEARNGTGKPNMSDPLVGSATAATAERVTPLRCALAPAAPNKGMERYSIPLSILADRSARRTAGLASAHDGGRARALCAHARVCCSGELAQPTDLIGKH